MTVTCLIEHLEKILPTLSKIIPLHAQLPILSNVLLEANKEGFFISTTDLELGLRIQIPAKIENEGAITIPGKYFIEVISSLPKDKVTISQEKDIVTVASHGNKIVFQTIPKDEFPDFFAKKGEKIFSFTQEQLKSIFSSCLFATSQDVSRAQLRGVYVTSSDTTSQFVATDGFRLSIKNFASDKQKEFEPVIISARLLLEALNLKVEKNEEIGLYIDKEASQALFETKSTTLLGRLIEGEFPQFEKVIPKFFKTKLVIPKEDFIQAIKLVSVFAKESSYVIKLEIKDGVIELSAKSQGIGEGEAKIDIEQEGDDVEVSFNVKYILDVLRIIEKDRVVVELNSGHEPTVFTIPDDPSFMHIIMPVRVQQ